MSGEYRNLPRSENAFYWGTDTRLDSYSTRPKPGLLPKIKRPERPMPSPFDKTPIQPKPRNYQTI